MQNQNSTTTVTTRQPRMKQSIIRMLRFGWNMTPHVQNIVLKATGLIRNPKRYSLGRQM